MIGAVWMRMMDVRWRGDAREQNLEGMEKQLLEVHTCVCVWIGWWLDTILYCTINQYSIIVSQITKQ